MNEHDAVVPPSRPASRALWTSSIDSVQTGGCWWYGGDSPHLRMFEQLSWERILTGKAGENGQSSCEWVAKLHMGQTVGYA